MTVNDLSFDPHDPQFAAPGLPGVRFSVQIFTTHNLYGLNPDQTSVENTSDGIELNCTELSWAAQQQRAAGTASARVGWRDNVLSWHIHVTHTEPIKGVKLLLWGLPEEALRQGWWHAVSADDVVVHPSAAEPLSWMYPGGGSWQTPWACAGGAGTAICLSVRDFEVREKRLYVYPAPYAEHQTVVELVCDADAANTVCIFNPRDTNAAI